MIKIDTLNKDEALRYMGYKGQPITENMQEIIDDAAVQCLASARPVYTYRLFPIVCKEDRVEILNSSLYFEGQALSKHLKGCNECAIMCASLGAGFDHRLSVLQATDQTKSFIFNSCGSALIEQVCDAVEEEILSKTNKKKHNFRFSPGYGDLPLTAQKTIFRLLSPERTTGVNLTPTNLLIPIKSVTAILGLSEEGKKTDTDKCSICKFRDKCKLRKEGNTCANPGAYTE